MFKKLEFFLEYLIISLNVSWSRDRLQVDLFVLFKYILHVCIYFLMHT